jgi:hypothetical protein
MLHAACYMLHAACCSGSFDVVVEKCTIDAMLCAPRGGRQMSVDMIDEANRVRADAQTRARAHAHD